MFIMYKWEEKRSQIVPRCTQGHKFRPIKYTNSPAKCNYGHKPPCGLERDVSAGPGLSPGDFISG